ncbi:MAG: hypothetical protein HY540_00770 [Deltaproteobacteria bacterium]|nr:hypothetical protein [Deltaproteobacteria bacterium]
MILIGSEMEVVSQFLNTTRPDFIRRSLFALAPILDVRGIDSEFSPMLLSEPTPQDWRLYRDRLSQSFLPELRLAFSGEIEGYLHQAQRFSFFRNNTVKYQINQGKVQLSSLSPRYKGYGNNRLMDTNTWLSLWNYFNPDHPVGAGVIM